MRKIFRSHWVMITGVGILALPLIAIGLVLVILHKNIFDNPDFWYGYMAYFGSVILAGVAMQQAKKGTELSQKFDTMNARQNYSFAQMVYPATIIAKIQDDMFITSEYKDNVHDRPVILLEDQLSDQEISSKTMVYTLDLSFRDNSKAAIKAFCLNVPQCTCIQSPSNNSLRWADGSNDKIQTGFKVTPFGNYTFPQWISDNEFQIRLKIYAPLGNVFMTMIESGEPCCLVFHANLMSVCGICTQMKYRCWVEKVDSEYCVSRVDSRLINVFEEATKNAD